MLLAIGAGFVMASRQEAGGLLFILSPLVMVLIVRFLEGCWSGLVFQKKLGMVSVRAIGLSRIFAFDNHH